MLVDSTDPNDKLTQLLALISGAVPPDDASGASAPPVIGERVRALVDSIEGGAPGLRLAAADPRAMLPPRVPAPAPTPPQSRPAGWQHLIDLVGPLSGAMFGSQAHRTGFARGWTDAQRLEQQDQERQQQFTERESDRRFRDQSLIDERQRLIDKSRTDERLMQTRARERFLKDAGERLNNVTRPEEFEEEMSALEGQAAEYGLKPADLRAQFRYTPLRADRDRQKEARKLLDGMKKDPVTAPQYYHPVFQQATTDFRGERKTIKELRAIAGDLDWPADTTADEGTTFGELYTGAKGTPFETQHVPMLKDGHPDLKTAATIARQNGWLKAATGGHAQAPERASQQYTTKLRQQLEGAMLAPGTDTTAIRKRMEAAGLTWSFEVSHAASAVDKRRRDAARGGQALERVPPGSLADPAAAADQRFRSAQDRLDELVRTVDPLLAPKAKPAPTDAPQTTGQTLTRRELRAVASRLGISESEAERQARTRGFTVVP